MAVELWRLLILLQERGKRDSPIEEWGLFLEKFALEWIARCATF
jgi:hypothetical protein